MLALLILVQGTGRLIATITAFTLAHSLTLFAATLGWLDVPGPPVEAIIAFAFGLLHGLGFAGALAEVGLPPLSIPLALLFFNVGVEIGQLIFIAAVLAIIAVGRRTVRSLELSAPGWLWRIPPYAIGGLAGFWVVERVAGFWSVT